LCAVATAVRDRHYPAPCSPLPRTGDTPAGGRGVAVFRVGNRLPDHQPIYSGLNSVKASQRAESLVSRIGSPASLTKAWLVVATAATALPSRTR